MPANGRARLEADYMWYSYDVPLEVGVASKANWVDDGQGTLSRPLGLSFDGDPHGAAPVPAVFVVSYSPETGDLSDAGQLRLTGTGVVLGSTGVWMGDKAPPAP